MKKFELTWWLYILLGIVFFIQGVYLKELGQLLERLIVSLLFIVLPFIWRSNKIRNLFVLIIFLLYLLVSYIFN